MLSLFKRKHHLALEPLHEALVLASRQPIFYTQGQVPDTIDGRFELLVLHAFLLLRRLRGTDGSLAQQLFDRLFAQFDLNLRELGVGDMGVGKRIKFMAKSFLGRLQVYEDALVDTAQLHSALSRNLFGTLPEAPPEQVTAPFVIWMNEAVLALHNQPNPAILAGKVSFPVFPVSAT
jgi:cytochrome b pre-mRNA-processing protein 3